MATAFLVYANFDLGIIDYHHLVAYFGSTIKQIYCIEFPIDKTLRHSSTTVARHYVNCSTDHRFVDSQQMYTYKLATKAWHRLLQLNGSPVNPPPSGTLTIQIPIIIDQLNIKTFTHCDNLQRHIKAHYAKQGDFDVNHQFNQGANQVQHVILIGMFIRLPIDQTFDLLFNVGFVVFCINGDVNVLLCKVCCVCLEPNPCQVCTHLLMQANH